jgi:hypothetical protein
MFMADFWQTKWDTIQLKYTNQNIDINLNIRWIQCQNLFQITPSYLCPQNLFYRWNFILLKFLVFFNLILIFSFFQIHCLISYPLMIIVFVLYGCVTFYGSLRIKEVFRESFAEEGIWVWERRGKWNCRKLYIKTLQGLTPHQMLFRQNLETCETGGAR